MDACGPGWHLQIARTTSDDGLANGSLISHSGGLSNCFLADSQHSRTLAASGNASAMGEATKGIVQVKLSTPLRFPEPSKAATMGNFGLLCSILCAAAVCKAQ